MNLTSTSYDYVVVGGGSAGCVTASRLVLEHSARVLLLEAGPSDRSPLIRMPAGSFKMMFGKSPYIKRYTSAPQAMLGGRTVSIPQGHVVGGSSSINVMAYTRGSRLDYERWQEATDRAGWGWDDLLPYFRRQEGNQRLRTAAHGQDGPLKVSDPVYAVPAADHFIKTLQRLGVQQRNDLNDGTLTGAAYMQTTIANAERCSAARAFLEPARSDPRLTVLTGALATKVILEDRRAVAVEYEHEGQRHQARGAREIILTAGVFATPKLLMLSGIGPSNDLARHGIEVVQDLPGVGQNLQDHNITFLTATTRGAFGYFGEDRGLRMMRNALRYVLFRKGPMASNGAETMAFVNLAEPAADPDIQLYCLGVLWPSIDRTEQTHGVTLMANLVKPKSRGRVTLRSADAHDDPVVDPGWLTHPDDTARLLTALKYLRRIAATAPFAAMVREERLPGAASQSDAELTQYIRDTTESNYHPVGTCKMGTDHDPMAVLTPDLRVRGLSGLRVFDASMMPTIISSNTNATVMAVADRGVDLMFR
jgi:choline dehydrogenase-like flavoprotein